MTNGGITIEYGFQIEGILSSDNIWTFNFHDPVFDCQENQNMITFYTGEERTTFFFCHKQLLSHHSSYLNLELKENDMMEISDYFIDCFDYLLQIGHGVRGIGGVHKTYETLEFALEYKLPNVIQLIDQTARINSWRLENLVSEAIYYGLKHRLAEFLREQRTAEELVEVLKKMDLETMSGEIMKKCVKRFLELEIMEEEPSVFV
uniref:BTB domain-containing protein n=1 Tax=Caenorhabditis tropicalis TaxID=1561998 RepID=A0A1I7UKS4_9PELO